MEAEPVGDSTEPIYLKWCGWLQTIHDDLTQVALTREVWGTINEIVGKHPAMPPSHLFTVLARIYATSQATAVRRQVDTRKGVVTIGRLLTEITNHPESVTREGFVALFPLEIRTVGDAQFNCWALPTVSYVDAARVNETLDNLKSKITPVKSYVNKRLAHLDADHPRVGIPTFDQLDVAIDALIDAFHSYSLLLTGVDIVSLTPVPQYDWLAPLRIPWIPSNA